AHASLLLIVSAAAMYCPCAAILKRSERATSTPARYRYSIRRWPNSWVVRELGLLPMTLVLKPSRACQPIHTWLRGIAVMLSNRLKRLLASPRPWRPTDPDGASPPDPMSPWVAPGLNCDMSGCG